MSGFGGFCPLPLRLGGDAETGWAAAQHARACADLAAAKRATPLAVFSFTQSGSTVTLTDALCAWGGTDADYQPTGAYGGGTGVSTWTYDTSAEDAYEQAWPVTFRHAVGGAIHDGTCYLVNCAIAPPNKVTVSLFTRAGIACSGAATVVLW